MLTILNGIKTKALALMGMITGALLLYISVLQKRSVQREAKRLKLELERNEATLKSKLNASEALRKGLENEKTPVDRGYFDRN